MSTVNIPPNTTTSKPTNKLCQVCFVHDKSSNNTSTTNEYCECIDCSIIVHLSCYGLQSIDIIPSSSNKFICDACKERKHKTNTEIKCYVCPISGGALKRTSCNKWCHLFCALWIPEIGIANIITKSPIININKIPTHRKNKNCSICNNLKKKKRNKNIDINNNNYVSIKCEYYQCIEYVHPMCTTIKNKGNLLIHKNDILNIANNNHMVQNAIRKLGSFFWCFLCNKHSNTDINHIKRIEILKILQNEWPYWKIHPNPIFKPNTQKISKQHDDKMMQVMDIINADNLLLEPLPTQKMINRYENIIYSMHNMPLSLSTNIGPIGLLQKRIKDKYDRNTKYQTNLHKTTQSLHWNEIQNTLNYNINASNASYDLSDEEQQTLNNNNEINNNNNNNNTNNKNIPNVNDDITRLPLYDKLKRDDIELSRNEVINLLWNSKEKFFNSITCEDYLRMSPYDYRYDPCFSMPVIGKPFFNKNNNKIIKGMTDIHYYNMEDVTDANLSLNENMGLPQPINYGYIPLIKHRLGLNETSNSDSQININFNDIMSENDINNNIKWDGKYESYLTKNDIMGWRWVLNRWKPPKHLSSVSCICLQCKESIDIYNKKYMEAINEYTQIKKLIPNFRETEYNDKDVDKNKQTQHIEKLQKIFNQKEEENNENKSDSDHSMDIDQQNDNVNVIDDNEPKVLQYQEEPLKRIPVIIKSKHGKVLANFRVLTDDNVNINADINNNKLYNAIPIDLGPNPPPIYDKMNDILEAKNTPKPKIKKSSSLHNLGTITTTSQADDTSECALNALYKQMSNRNNKRTYSQMTLNQCTDNNNNNNNDNPPLNPPLKKRKLTNQKDENSDNENENEQLITNLKEINDIEIDDENMVELDSFRNLENLDILMENNKKDSLCKHLSDTVYELYERIRSNDSIKHMIRTNLANKVKTKSMIQYEKLHEIVVKHAIEHSCIWLRIRTSLARGYSDLSGTFSIPITRENDHNDSEQDEDYSVCTACFDGSFSDDNPIVFCDECNVGIHRYCYGIVRVPYEDDKWYCDSCNWLKNNKLLNKNNINCKPQCCLCPINGCALKQTKSGGFAHVACALWINGIDIGNLKRMNPICGVLKVQQIQTKSAIKIHSKMLEIGLKINNGITIEENEKEYLNGIGEWTHKCIVCDDDNGCFIECGHNQCISRMHVLCGWFAGYNMRIKMNDETGSISCVIYCPKHTPLKYDGKERNLDYYKQIRGNGTTERKNMILMEKKRNKYQKLTAKLIRFPDKYPHNICCICFTDYKEFKLIKCIKCNINIHDKCYCIDNIQDINNWQCDVCIKFPEYYKTLLFPMKNNNDKNENSDTESGNDSDDIDVQRVFNLECIECVFCPRRGGAFKQIEIQNEIKYIHVCCGQWINGIRFNKKLNKFLISNNNEIEKYKHLNDMCYLCNKKQLNIMDIIIQCQYNLCNKKFHIICGLFGDCYLKAHKSDSNNEFEFKFYCKMHKYNSENEYKINGTNESKTNINLSKLGQHLLHIKRLRLKLDKIKLTNDRITEYELNQRGMVNNTTKSYKECGTYYNKSNKNKDRKLSNKNKRKNNNNKKNNNKHNNKKSNINNEYKDKESDYDIEMRRSSRRSTRSKKSVSKKYKNKQKSRKRRHKHNDEYMSEYSDNIMIASENDYYISESEYDENEEKLNTRMRSHKSKKKKNKINRKETHIAPDGIRMATDIWAEQYHYEGGEIKWPVVKRNGWFMAIPRLKLPKGNKYRYSHLERKQKQELLEKEKRKEREEKNKRNNGNNNLNPEWNNFLSLIKEKETELGQGTNDSNNNNNNDNNKKKIDGEVDGKEEYVDNTCDSFQKYAAGGPGWELTNDLNQPKNTAADSNDNLKVCPYCKKVKKQSVSIHNWQRHLNAKHVFKCKKCKLYFTRHQLLTKHLEVCNGNQ